MKRIILLLSLCLTSTVALATEFTTPTALAKLFSANHLNGTMVVFDATKQQYLAVNPQRAQQPFIPASTFKIPNSLIGLATGAAKDVDQIIYRYDGKPLYLKSWQQDMSLRQAIKVSNVPAYQALAREIGLKAMQQNIDKLHYGNQKIGNQVDNFWLKGPLKISAVAQTQFLAKLALGQLSYPQQLQADVREISLLEQGKNWTLYGKTGLSRAYSPSLGWFVGWLTVEQQGKQSSYSFALNMDMTEGTELNDRITLAKQGLIHLGLLPKA